MAGFVESMRKNGHIYKATHWEGADAAEIADVKAKGYEPATWFRSSTLATKKTASWSKAMANQLTTLPDIAYHCDKLERGF